MQVKAIQWSEELEPNDFCRYNHVLGHTPLGDFQITWKGWKDNNPCVVEETPWGFGEVWPTLEEAKAWCEAEFTNKIKECIEA